MCRLYESTMLLYNKGISMDFGFMVGGRVQHRVLEVMPLNTKR